MAMYLKNTKVYKLQIGQVHQAGGCDHVTQFSRKGHTGT